MRIALINRHKLSSAVYRYKKYLLSQKTEMSDEEEIYCGKRLQKEGYIKAKYFLRIIKKEIKEEIREINNKNHTILKS